MTDVAVAAQLRPDVVAGSSPRKLFRLGDRVRHGRFGTGQIVEISGRNVIVDFGHSGFKRIRQNYLENAA
jgi:hypothetical protein